MNDSQFAQWLAKTLESLTWQQVALFTVIAVCVVSLIIDRWPWQQKG